MNIFSLIPHGSATPSPAAPSNPAAPPSPPAPATAPVHHVSASNSSVNLTCSDGTNNFKGAHVGGSITFDGQTADQTTTKKCLANGDCYCYTANVKSDYVQPAIYLGIGGCANYK